MLVSYKTLASQKFQRIGEHNCARASLQQHKNTKGIGD